MKNARNFSTVFAAIVIAFLSIYAVDPNMFTANNTTSQPVAMTLSMQSGAQMPINVAPSSSLQVPTGNDLVIGATIYGMYVPAGSNQNVAIPSGGSIGVTWQGGGTVVLGTPIDPHEIN